MSWSVEVESKVSAGRMFKAAILEWHHLGPKLVPEHIASCVPIQGEGGVGSIRQINMTSAAPFSFVKERLDFVDHEKFECKSTMIEGGLVGTKLESVSAHFKFEPTSSGGCICKVVTSYKPLPGVDAADEIPKAKEAVTKHFKAVEAYLLANPGVYA